jgi:hypothetical protein
MLMGIREFAASEEIRARYGRAVAPSFITRMIQDGKLVMVGKKIDVAASMERMDALGVGKLRADVSQRHATEAQNSSQPGSAIPKPGQNENSAKNATEGATDSATDSAPDSDLGGIATGGQNKARYKSITLHFENQLIKLGMALHSSRRYYKQDVKDEAHALANAVRAGIERVIDQTAPRLAVIPGHADRGYLLRRAMRQVARMINREYPNALRRLRKSARSEK